MSKDNLVFLGHLPNSASPSSHNQHSQLIVVRKIVQYTLPFRCRAFSIDALELPSAARSFGEVVLE